MPKPTFYKLPDSKRKVFLLEAYKEFALHSLEAASITNLVKSLGIAKGSVYQYFDDKEDLYAYLIEDANRQLNQLLDKACPFNEEKFYDWYTKLLMVKLKFFLSFPQYAILFQKLLSESSNSLKSLAQGVESSWLNRISSNLPASLYDSPINNKILVRSPLLIFELLTSNLNLNKLIAGEDPVYLDSKELVSVCSEWVEKLKQGL
jgi:TetR/AcrR family transcriptional regulator